MAQPTELDVVTLRVGLTVPLTTLRVLWDLEERGFSVVVVDGSLRMSPRSRITAADDAAIRRHRDELLALVHYCEAVQ